MRPASRIAVALAVAPAVLASVALTACGGARRASSTGARSIYAAKWAPVLTLDSSGHGVQTVSRNSRTISLQVVDATCYPQDPRYADVGHRFDHVAVSEQSDAVIVTFFMRPEPAPPKPCAPAGVSFVHQVVLAHPLGARALVDGGEPKIGGHGALAVIRVPARSSRLERRAEARFGPPDLGAATP